MRFSVEYTSAAEFVHDRKSLASIRVDLCKAETALWSRDLEFMEAKVRLALSSIIGGDVSVLRTINRMVRICDCEGKPVAAFLPRELI